MARFLIRRVLFGIVVLWVVATVVFLLYYVAPHNVAATLAGKSPNPARISQIRHELGLDRPLIQQYGSYLWRLVHGDLGTSDYQGVNVRDLLLSRFSVDVSLAVGGATLWLALGLGVGIVAARHPRSIFDRAATVFVLTGISMPTFLLGIALLFFLSYQLSQLTGGTPFFPDYGYIGFTENPLVWAQHLILPWITLALIFAATYSRLTRGQLLDVFGEDFIRTARAKGLSERRVVYRHGLRAAITPVVTQFGIDVGTLFGGAIVTEQVFGLNGLGRTALQSIASQDLPVIMGTVVFASLFIVVANIVVDALYAVLDPRVRLS
jgi:peptide/nickel transport system permease protein